MKNASKGLETPLARFLDWLGTALPTIAGISFLLSAIAWVGAGFIFGLASLPQWGVRPEFVQPQPGLMDFLLFLATAKLLTYFVGGIMSVAHLLAQKGERNFAAG